MARHDAARPRRANYANHLVIMAKSPVAGRVKRRLGARDRRCRGDPFLSQLSVAHGAAACARQALAHAARHRSRPRCRRTLRAFARDARTRAARRRRSRSAHAPRFRDSAARPRRSSSAATFLRSRPDTSRKPSGCSGETTPCSGRPLTAAIGSIGLKRTPKLLAPFAGVRWSGRHALADTLANLKGKRIAFAATLRDVDTKNDYRDLRFYAERLISVQPKVAPSRLTRL